MATSLRILLGIVLVILTSVSARASQIGPTKFDHLTTGYELLNAHLNVPCESCHVGAIFKGTPRDCASCHSRGSRIAATVKPQNHVMSSSQCDACHTTVSWSLASQFDHQQVVGNCATCHNGIAARGQGVKHISSTTECEACHSVFGWKPVTRVDHTQVNGTCQSCHNGSVATGKPPNHIRTTDSCDSCHSTLAWKPANAMHTGNISNCVACHNGRISTGKSAKHLSTSDQCGSCHSVVVWQPVLSVDHTQVNGSCVSCHNGIVAKGKPPQHPQTDNSCGNCHATSAFLPANGSHNGISSNCLSCHNGKVAQGKPGNHVKTSDACQACHSVLVWKPQVTVDHTQVLGTCNSCHNGSSATGRPANHIPAAADCGVCHLTTAAFGPGTIMNHAGITSGCAACHESGKSWYGVSMVTRPSKAQDAAHPTTGDCSQCHSSTSSFMVDVSGGKPANHIPTSQTCSLCHADSGDYSIYKMNHAGITANCMQCHGAGLSFAHIVPKEPPANHIPTSTACENCHTATNFTAFGPGTPMSHAGITSNCASCHETGMNWFGVRMVDRPSRAQDANHPTTGDCSQCHSSTTSFTIVSAGKPANHIPTIQGCTLCHANASDYSVYVMNHTGITGNCAQCHAAGLSFANIVPKEPPGNHMPLNGLACENCHSTTNFGAFGPGTAMRHTGITGNCATCHETGLSWYGVSMVDRPTKAQDPNHPATGECANCHSSTTSFSAGITGGNKPGNHIPTTQSCTLCHATAGNYAVATMNHQGISGNCAQCHAAGLSFANIVPKEPPANHLPIGSLACENCHSPTRFSAFGPGTAMSHAGISGNCAACHETGMTWYGVSMVDRPTAAQDANHPASGDCSQCHASTTSFTNGLGKPANHIPTTQACTLCHTNAANYAVYTMNHAGITANCAQCHASGLSFANIVPKAPPAKHIPSTTACENCHSSTNFSAFGPGTGMSHTGITSNCASCHETGMSWYGVSMVDRPTAAQDASHPKSGDCSQCHTSTTSFSQGVSNKPSNHIPTSQPCTLCHSNPSDYSVYAMNHQGIANGCITCHGTGLSFANIVPKEPPANHIPTGRTACEGCHSATTFSSFSATKMNHTPVAAMACDACHETGMNWFGVQIVDRPRGHHTGQDCKGCHSTNSFNGGNAANTVRSAAQTVRSAATSAGASGGVASDSASSRGVVAGNSAFIGQRAGADVPSGPAGGAQRSSPASPSTFNLAGALGRLSGRTGTTGATRHFDHGSLQQACASCHNGLTAIGKDVRHLATGSSCDDCHTTIAWLPARFDHRSIAQTCASCHDAVHSAGKPAGHLQTPLACSNCHTTLAWQPAIFRHAGINGACQNCHNGVGAAGRPLQHMVSARDCESCHGTVAWDPPQYRHLSPRYPGSHREALPCTSCHKSNTEQASWSNPGLAPACGACHERAYRPQPHLKFGAVKYSAAELRDCTGACHIYTDASQRTVLKARPGPQHAVGAGDF